MMASIFVRDIFLYGGKWMTSDLVSGLSEWSRPPKKKNKGRPGLAAFLRVRRSPPTSCERVSMLASLKKEICCRIVGYFSGWGHGGDGEQRRLDQAARYHAQAKSTRFAGACLWRRCRLGDFTRPIKPLLAEAARRRWPSGGVSSQS